MKRGKPGREDGESVSRKKRYHEQRQGGLRLNITL